jgi:hypothetical protein
MGEYAEINVISHSPRVLAKYSVKRVGAHTLADERLTVEDVWSSSRMTAKQTRLALCETCGPTRELGVSAWDFGTTRIVLHLVDEPRRFSSLSQIFRRRREPFSSGSPPALAKANLGSTSASAGTIQYIEKLSKIMSNIYEDQ